MASVDDRIVAMKFDNDTFQKKVADTIKSMDDLKKSLDFANQKKGMEELQTASRNLSFEGIASALDGLSGKFTAMGAIAFSVLQNVTNMAIHAGVQLAKNLSLDQVIGGFHEYETNMNSIQTIMANTKSDGSTLDDVNKALDQLNTYSDQTIYNFSQMAKNIGTFTAAGVDLGTSVDSIKGIANLAAISGSNADQASTAMYQLSQALASGSVKLMDWNSIVNAGMGGEVFQKALFETGKALGTIKDVPMSQTFDQWKDAGNTFRDSLQDGWITADVLTNTLKGFTGDLTEAQIKAMGYTDEQTKQIMEMGKTGKDAATQIKTLSQLISTVKESIGSGWTRTFQIVFGDFEEAKTLFTDVNDALGVMISTSADARNKVLGDWKALGGRTQLIAALKAGFEALIGVIKIVSGAFHDIFPAVTGTRLLQLTVEFKNFMESLKPTPAVAVLLTRIFRGLFAALSIGWNVIKGTIGFFKDLFDFFKPQTTDPNQGVLGWMAKVGDGLTTLQQALVGGGGIINFFHDLELAVIDFIQNFSFQNVVDTALGLLKKLKDAFVGLFIGAGAIVPPEVTDALQRMGDRLGWIVDIAHAVGDAWDWVKDHLDNIKKGLEGFLTFVKDKFSNLPQLIADALSGTDYSSALSTIDVGLFGGLVLMIRKFLNSDKLDFSGIIDKIKGAFGGLTDTLQAMQTKLKADALKSIAIAIGLLVASLVVLSMIDSENLTRGFSAMAIGFGFLVTAMGVLNQVVSGPTDAAKLGLLATGLILLSGAMILLSIAAKIFSTMNWEEISKGLLGVGTMLGILAGFMKILPDSASMISTGLGLIAIGVALNIIALAVKSFAEMQWESMGQGLTGIAGGLVAIGASMNLMPDGMVLKGVGLIAVAVALNILALALKSFAEMKWDEMGKGLAGIGASLVLLTVALSLMPNGVSLALQGAGLLMIGIGLVMIAQAVKSMSGMSWAEMARGLAALAGTLLILGVAAAAMQGSIGGAIAIGIMAVVLGKLAEGLQKFAKLKWMELLHGLVALAAVLAVLGIAAMLLQPAIGALLALGGALILIGAGMALFGLGANLIAGAFAIIATAGTQGVKTLSEALHVLIDAMPAMIGAFASGLIILTQKVLEALPGIVKGLDATVKALIQLLIDNIPGIVDAGIKLITALLDAIVQLSPKVVETGFQLLMSFLKGIRDHIEEIVTVVVEIITNFIDGIAANMTVIVGAGLTLLISFLKGISDNLSKLVGAVGDIITKFTDEIANQAVAIMAAGTKFIIKVIEGFGKAVTEIGNAIVQMAVDFSAQCVVWAGKLAAAGKDFILGIMEAFSKNAIAIADGMFVLLTNFLNGMAEVIRTRAPELRAAGLNLVKGIIEGLIGESATGLLASAAKTMAKNILGPFGTFLDIGSPSKVFMEQGKFIVLGLALGLAQTDPLKTGAEGMATTVQDSFAAALAKIPETLAAMTDFQPTITPVLDLTNVTQGAGQLGSIFGNPNLAATASYNQAVLLSLQQRPQEEADVPATNQPKEITFIQNNHSPEALSTVDIFRQTRSQIAMAKEELALT